MNCDGALLGEGKDVGVGIVVRDSDGSVLWALSQKVRVVSCFMVEAIVVRMALMVGM